MQNKQFWFLVKVTNWNIHSLALSLYIRWWDYSVYVQIHLDLLFKVTVKPWKIFKNWITVTEKRNREDSAKTRKKLSFFKTLQNFYKTVSKRRFRPKRFFRKVGAAIRNSRKTFFKTWTFNQFRLFLSVWGGIGLM